MRAMGRRVIWAAVLIGLPSSPAGAYVPRPEWLMSQMAQQREKMSVRRLKVELLCGLTEDQRHSEVLYLKAPRLVRREQANDSVEICRDGKCMRKRGDQQPERQPDWVYLQYLYFVEPNPTGDRFMRLMHALRIDTKVDTLTRAGKRVAIVLGAKEWERDRPQLWLDKDRFLPLRLMVRDRQTLVDIRWRNWGTRVSGDWFPAELEIRKDGKLVDACTTVHVEANPSLADKLFRLQTAVSD